MSFSPSNAVYTGVHLFFKQLPRLGVEKRAEFSSGYEASFPIGAEAVQRWLWIIYSRGLVRALLLHYSSFCVKFFPRIISLQAHYP